MRQGQPDTNGFSDVSKTSSVEKHASAEAFVLEKNIFSNIFGKDIRRVYIYKKAERLAKAIHLISPAFADSLSLRTRIDAIAVRLVDSAVLPPGAVREPMARELLALSSVLAIARTGNLLSAMNAELIAREAHILLAEVAMYEEPRLSLDDVPTLAALAKLSPALERAASETARATPSLHAGSRTPQRGTNSIKDNGGGAPERIKDRQEAIMSVIRTKGDASIKDISILVRGVSEKTIQRELASLISAGIIAKKGERRWSVYSLV